MSELTDSLRHWAYYYSADGFAEEDLNKAADLIEQQQKKIDEMSKLCLTNAEVDKIKALAVEDFVDNDLRNACLANGWDTESSAYEVHLMLNDYANKIRNGG